MIKSTLKLSKLTEEKIGKEVLNFDAEMILLMKRTRNM